MYSTTKFGEILNGLPLGTETVRFSHGRLQPSTCVTRLVEPSRGVLR
jgi:hypothetical protein